MLTRVGFALSNGKSNKTFLNPMVDFTQKILIFAKVLRLKQASSRQVRVKFLVLKNLRIYFFTCNINSFN